MGTKNENPSGSSIVKPELLDTFSQRLINITKLRRREDGEIVYVLAEGPVANLLGLPTIAIKGKTVKEALGYELAEVFEPLFKKAFNGEIVQYTYRIKDYIFTTILVPTFENQQVTEVIGTSLDISDQIELQEKLKESEKFYRSITENSSDIVMMINADGTIKYISGAFKRIFSYDVDYLIGKNVFDYVHPEDYERIYKLYKNSIENRPTNVPFEAKFKNKDGSDVFIEAVASNHLDDPNLQAIIINARDITERKEALRKLEESEERFRTMVEKLPSGTLYRKDERIWINKRAEEITGYKSEELKTIDQFFEKLFAKRAKEIYEIYSKDREENLKATRLFPIIKKDGSIRYVKFSGYKDDKHEFWILHDVSDITEMQNKLISVNNLLETIFEVTKDAIIIAEPIKDTSGKIKDFEITHKNQSVNKLINSHDIEKKSKTILELFPELKKSGNFDKLVNVVNRKEILNFEQIKLIDQDEKWYHFFVTPYRNGLLLICTDVTKTKKYEKDLKNYIEQVQKSNLTLQRNSEELQKLYNKVAESEKKLKEEIEAKDKFFGIIAHDLRDSISGFISLTKEIINDFNKIPIEELSTIASTLKDSADNLFLMLDNLLYWSRLQRNIIKYEPQKIDLNYEFKENIINMFTKELNDKEIKIENNISLNSEVWGDIDMIRIIFKNVLSNAVKYSNIGDTIRIFSEEYDPSTLLICVKDTGIGMNEEILEKIFKINANIVRKGTKDEMGSGIGLIITKELIDRHKGKIWIESKENKGTCFKFTLPSANSNQK